MRLGAVLSASLVLAACGPTVDLDTLFADASVSSIDDAGTPALDAGAMSSEPDAGAPTPDAGPSVLLYPLDRKHSPLTAEVVTSLQRIAARSTTRRANVFSKVGDSNTVNPNYLSCFAGTQVDLAGRTALEPALTFFRGGLVGTTTSFDRVSLAATVGWSASAAIAGTPSPLQQELDATQARYATVMFGTNDVGFMDPYAYGQNLATLIDVAVSQGVVPILTTVPPRDDSATAEAWVARYNLVARGLAQARQVPFVDLHRELQPVPAHGLGPDGIHLNVYAPSAVRGCALTTAGLGFGQNVRNLATLEALSRARTAVQSGAASDTEAPRRAGTGLPGEEIAITTLPFVDVRDTRVDGMARLDAYPGCGSAANESGKEVLYRLELAQPATLRLFVVALGGSDLDLHVLSSTVSGQACVARHDKVLVRPFAAGTHWLSIDTFKASAGVLAGEYVLVVMPE